MVPLINCGLCQNIENVSSTPGLWILIPSSNQDCGSSILLQTRIVDPRSCSKPGLWILIPAPNQGCGSSSLLQTRVVDPHPCSKPGLWILIPALIQGCGSSSLLQSRVVDPHPCSKPSKINRIRTSKNKTDLDFKFFLILT